MARYGFAILMALKIQTISVQTRLQVAKRAISQISILEFNKKENSPDNGKQPSTLYRFEGEPIPGKLIWIRQKDIAIESPLGIIPIPRQGVRRYMMKIEHQDKTLLLTKFH